jgi:hypothetical protein
MPKIGAVLRAGAQLSSLLTLGAFGVADPRHRQLAGYQDQALGGARQGGAGQIELPNPAS